ncbi:MAG TPA: hypothetical protein VGN20_00520 [Mucilaginibacter sp.]|jgi:hypothetical protein
MSDTTSITDIIHVTFDSKKYAVGLQINLLLCVVIILLSIGFVWLFKVINKKSLVKTDVQPVELEIDFGGVKTKYHIERNYENVEIAHRLHVELITRKAALLIEGEYDIIEEVYDSWHILFQLTRDELKKIPGKLLQQNESTAALEKLAIEILNKGLRPHLTEYQTKFRRWYDAALKDDTNKEKSPQEIQRMYVDYEKLMDSMKKVNVILREYAGELEKLISA